MTDADPLATEEALERLRRSVAMLAPRTAAGLDRETAMRVLAELGDLRSRDRRIRALAGQLVALLDDQGLPTDG